MHCEVHAKGSSRIVWTRRCYPDTTCSSVRTRFCKLYGIPANACRLECDGWGELLDQTLGQLNCPSAVLKLTASFDLTLGLCIWGCLTICNSAIGAPAEAFWSIGAHLLSAGPSWDLLQLNNPQELSKLIALPADTTVPEAFAAKANDSSPPDWSAVDSSVHPLLVLMHAYMDAAPTFHPAHSVISMANATTTSVGKVMESFITSHSTYASRVFTSATPSGYIQKLRTALLLLKVVSALSIIKAPDSCLHGAKTSLCLALANTIQADQEEMRESEMSEAKLLSSHIVKMAIPAMKPLFTTNPIGSICCCFALQRLMFYGTTAVYQNVGAHVASELIHGGGIPVLIAAVGTSSGAEPELSALSAAAAVEVLHSLTSRAVLPSALVDQAEDLMLRLQALPRLSGFLKLLTLTPTQALGKTTGVAECSLKLESWMRIDQDPCVRMFTAAELMNRILKQQPTPSDPHIPLPTPSAAAWTAIQAMAEQVASSRAFVESYEPKGSLVRAFIKGTTSAPVGPDDEHYDYIRLQQELVELPCNLLAGHLPNLDLDVRELMRARLNEVLADWHPVAKSNPSMVSFAFVRRLARDSSILLLQPEDLGKASQEHKCLGCFLCCGPAWEFKTETVAKLCALFCYRASQPACHTSAAVSVQALYHILSKDAEQCKHLLAATHSLASAHMQDMSKGLHAAIQALAGCLPTQLIAVACLARLCTQELKQAGREAAAIKTPWFTKAVKEGTWDLAYTCIFSTLEAGVAVPWPPLLCSALAAAMSMMADLQTGVVDRPAIIQHAVPTLQFAERLLTRLTTESPMVSDSVTDRYHLLSACVDFITAFAEHTALQPHPTVCAPEGLFQCLTHALVDYTYDTEGLGKALEAAKSQQQGPNSLGWTGEELLSLQPRILSCYAAPCKTAQPLVHFWRLAMLHFPQAFTDHVEAAIDPELNGPDDRPDMAPYLAMLERFFGLGSESALEDMPSPPQPPGQAVLTMLRALSYFTICLVESEQKLGKAKQVLKSALRVGNDTAVLMKEYTKAEGRLAKDKSWFDVLLDSLEKMRTSNVWAPSFAVLPDDPANSIPRSSEFEPLLSKALASKEETSTALSPAVARRLQACFSKLALDPQVSVQPSASRTENSARTAYEELMLEEEQAATKAAAKKAKKLKQKAKKKNKQQAAPVMVDNATAKPSLDDEEEEDQFRLPEAAAASDPSLRPALDTPSAEQLPSALDPGLPTTAPARAVLATDGAGPQQAPLLDSHGLKQSEDATSAMHTATEQEDSKGSDSSSSQSGGGTASGGKADSDAHFLQALFCCPITKAQMVEPIIAADGYTYEKSAWQAWLQHSSTSAVTGEPLPHTRFVPNVLIKSAINANQERQHPK